MKQLCLFLLVLVVINIGESNNSADDPSKAVKYHGARRYWTSVDSYRKTYIALNMLKALGIEPVKLFVPKDKNVDRVLSDITLFSPTNDEDACKADNSNLEFKLVFDNENWIRGQVFVQRAFKQIKAYLYEKCPGEEGAQQYILNTIDETEVNFQAQGRSCFTRTNPFHSSVDRTKNVMELQVTSTFKCKVFLILPAYMDVEDEVLPPATREPVNETFAAEGEKFWWKSDNDASLSNGIFFLQQDVVIDITKSNKSVPYFLRIGKNQPYPSMTFKHAPCAAQQYDLIVNLHDSAECRLKLSLTETGYKITAKGFSTEIIDETTSPTFVFARGQAKVYVKAGTHLFITAMDVCPIENVHDVPADQFVLQLVPSEDYAPCNLGQVIVSGGDVKGKIEVLIDRAKAAALIAQSVMNQNGTTIEASSDNSTVAAPADTTTTKSEEAGFQWWWILIVGLLVVIIIGVAVGLYFCICSCRRRKQNEQKQSESPKSHVHGNRKIKRAADKLEQAQQVLTAIHVDEPPPKKVSLPSSKKPTQELALQTTQVEISGSATIPSRHTFEKIEREKEDRRNLYRNIYGPAGFAHMKDAFDYHQNESKLYASLANYTYIHRPPWTLFDNNFWGCIGHICQAKKFGELLQNYPSRNVYFYIRDCVKDVELYAHYHSLSTRLHEPVKQHANRGDEKVYVIRVFILSYEPLTMEFHCRGECPEFLFYFLECDDCVVIEKKLRKNPTAVASRETWEAFVCRVNQTPLNSHQFLSYNGPAANVEDVKEINYMVVLRGGEKKIKKLRKCSRGCSFENTSHPNTIEFDRLAAIQTQTTQSS